MTSSRFRYVRVTLLVVSLILFSLFPKGMANPGFTLEKNRGAYDLVASNIPLDRILQRIDSIEPSSLRLFGDQDRVITATYRGLSLDELLYRLGVSYVLVYEGNEQQGFELSDAMLVQSDAHALDPETRAIALKLIRDLKHDDIRYNAHAAMWQLEEMGCRVVSLLEQALHGDDYQGVQMAASLLRKACPDYVPSDKLLEITLNLFRGEQYDASEYWSLFTPSEAFAYFLKQTGVYSRVRFRLINNLNSTDPQERLMSALLLGEYGENWMADRLVKILAPHLADNDLKSDAAVAAHALYRLGPAALPHLASYRTSPDTQQAEMAELICTALETGNIPERFIPVMYVGYSKNPLLVSSPWLTATCWDPQYFPNEQGQYVNRASYRPTAQDYYSGDRFNYQHESGTFDESQEGTSDTEPPFPFDVGEGETIKEIAQRFSISIDRLKAANPDLDLDLLKSGTRINIPWF